MSIPIKSCMFVAAAKGDEKALEGVIRRLKINNKCGSMTVHPCECDPKCDATDEELDALNEKIQEATKEA